MSYVSSNRNIKNLASVAIPSRNFQNLLAVSTVRRRGLSKSATRLKIRGNNSLIRNYETRRIQYSIRRASQYVKYFVTVSTRRWASVRVRPTTRCVHATRVHVVTRAVTGRRTSVWRYAYCTQRVTSGDPRLPRPTVHPPLPPSWPRAPHESFTSAERTERSVASWWQVSRDAIVINSRV